MLACELEFAAVKPPIDACKQLAQADQTHACNDMVTTCACLHGCLQTAITDGDQAKHGAGCSPGLTCLGKAGSHGPKHGTADDS